MKIALSVTGVMFQMLSVWLGYLSVSHFLDTETEDKNFWRFRKNKSRLIYFLGALFVSLMIFLKGFIFDNEGFLRVLMNAECMIWLAILADIDAKEKIIPNEMILAGLLFWSVLVVLEIFVAKSRWESVILYSLIGGFVCGGVLMIIALLVKTALGMGDVKMFFVLGLLYGLWDTYSILLASIIIMAVVSVVLLLLKKVTAKTAIPMAPFVVLGYMVCIFGGM